MQRVARVRPLAPTRPSHPAVVAALLLLPVIYIQAEREKLEQLGNRAPHARAVTRMWPGRVSALRAAHGNAG